MLQRVEKRDVEREAFERPVTFQVSAHRAASSDELTRKGVCIDISSSGLGLATNCHLHTGEVMEVHLPIGVKDVTVRVFAEVRWSASAGGNGRTGLRFL